MTSLSFSFRQPFTFMVQIFKPDTFEIENRSRLCLGVECCGSTVGFVSDIGLTDGTYGWWTCGTPLDLDEIKPVLSFFLLVTVSG